MKTLSKSRDLSFDVTRVVCTLWIVGIWHLMNYIPNQAPAALTTGIGEPVTITALSCFMFISGYFLRKYPFRDRADVLTFYRKRFSRFYGLYFLSAITLLIGGFFTDKSWFDSYHQFFLTLCGLTTFSPPQPGTLWFMSMLMFFYLVTPFIQYGKIKILNATVLLLIMLLWGQVATIDRSVFLYYLMYVLGLYCTPQLVKKFNGHISILPISLAVWICLTELIPLGGWGGVRLTVKITYSIVGIIFLLCLSPQLAKITRLHKIIQVLAYLSLALYLFHRQIYQFVMVIYSYFEQHVAYLKRKWLWLVYILSSAMLFIGFIILSKYMDSTRIALKWFGYNNPLVLISSVAFFLIFALTKMKNSVVINTIAASTLVVYICHSSNFSMSPIIRAIFAKVNGWYDFPLSYVCLLGYAIVVFAVIVGFDVSMKTIIRKVKLIFK